MNTKAMEATALELVALGKGILAADESGPTIEKRFKTVGVTSTEHQIEVSLWARNLTNDNYLISTFPTVAQDGSYSGYPNAPRTYGVTVRKSF